MATQPQTPAVKSLQCPNCGGTVTLRGFGQTLSVVCIQCLSILDAKSPGLEVLQTFQAKERYTPRIPLGKRGKLHGDPYEAIGFQVRSITVEGVDYFWSEYVLFNPYKGFRYLTEYNGHWNDVIGVKSLPQPHSSLTKKAVKHLNEVYKHFQSAKARSEFVMGEFPWRVRVGEIAVVEDYVSPPRMLSSEATGDEVTWSLGEYTTGAHIWKAFELPGSPPPAVGVFANEPSPHIGNPARYWKAFGALVALLLLAVVWFAATAPRQEVFRQSYRFARGTPGEASFVTSGFEFKGSSPQNVEVRIATDLENDWAYFNLALINEETGVAYDFGREVSYYWGTDSDGRWTEGGKRDSVTVPAVQPGRYYLRIEPEMEAGAAGARSMTYQVAIRWGVPSYWWFLVAFILLLVPPVLVSWRAMAFEQQRWAESDTGSAVALNKAEDDED